MAYLIFSSNPHRLCRRNIRCRHRNSQDRFDLCSWLYYLPPTAFGEVEEIKN
jgi:hypothetical protein